MIEIEEIRETTEPEPDCWVYWNTFLGRRVERSEITGNFRIIGGQVTVKA